MKIEKRDIKKQTQQPTGDCQCNYQNDYYGDQVCVKSDVRK